MDEYWSDEFSSSSDEEYDTIDEPEIWCQRELDYWKIEDIMEEHRPPPVIEFIENLNSFYIREAVVLPIMDDPCDVMDLISASNWHAFWQKGRENTKANFSFEDFEALSEYCLMMCEAIQGKTTDDRLRSCILRLIGYGKFH